MLSLIKEIYSYIATGYTGKDWKPRKRNFGERPTQLQFKLNFIARIYIDMKVFYKECKKINKPSLGLRFNEGILYQTTIFKDCIKLKWIEYKKWAKEFKESGSIRNCPDYVYFIGE